MPQEAKLTTVSPGVSQLRAQLPDPCPTRTALEDYLAEPTPAKADTLRWELEAAKGAAEICLESVKASGLELMDKEKFSFPHEIVIHGCDKAIAALSA